MDLVHICCLLTKKATKVEGKRLRMAMYEQWVFDHPL
jgi:hypothetical protein